MKNFKLHVYVEQEDQATIKEVSESKETSKTVRPMTAVTRGRIQANGDVQSLIDHNYLTTLNSAKNFNSHRLSD